MMDHHIDARSTSGITGAALGSGERQLCVRRLGEGWCVEGDGLERLMFRAGSEAESQARDLARALARCGDDTCVRVHDARGLLVGVIRYYGTDPSVIRNA